jgi:hypothetical protein
MKKIISWFAALSLGLLVIAPAFNYSIPVLVNSYTWTYAVAVSALLGFVFIHQKVHFSLKILIPYLFANCFLSQVPYLGFNAYILIVASCFFFLLFQNCNFNIILTVLASAFWLEVILSSFQLLGMDKLLSFNSSESVFLGTVMQYMRFSSVLAILTPFLILKSRWYVIPVGILCVVSQSSSFMLSFLACVGYPFFMNSTRRERVGIISIIMFFIAVYAVYDFGSFRGAILPENGGRLISWLSVLNTWVMDTSTAQAAPFMLGPINWQWVFLGHGIDTFLPLFPVYKHDMNPFPQAHNCWLQFVWEIGLVGFSLISWYVFSISKELYQRGRFDLLGGLICIGVNMFFAFPTRMTQTALLIVAYLAYCERVLNAEQDVTEP